MSQDPGITRRKLISGIGAAGASVFVLKLTQSPGVRQQWLAKLDPYARQFGYYTAYQLNRAEYVGSIHGVPGTFDLQHLGYEPHPLAAAKYHPDTMAIDDGSWRRIDEANLRWQWHVHAWIDDDRVELFSHYEYRPDLGLLGDESTTDMRQRLDDHYNPKWDINHDVDEANYFLGEACPAIRGLADRE